MVTRPRCASSTTAGRSRTAGLSVTVSAASPTTATSGATASRCDDLGGTARTLDERRRPDRARAGRHVALGPRRARRLAARSCSRRTAGSARATAAGTTSTCSPTAHDYAGALQAFYAVSGRPPVLPRWTLGNWWSRYHRYSADTYLALLDRFEPRACRSRSPCSTWTGIASTRCPTQYGRGWTGYSWEPTLFPDPEGFLAELHRRGLRVTLNVHPADGVQPFEDAYPAMADGAGPRPRRRRADRLRRHRPRRSSRPTSRCCTTGSRTRAWTSGGSTGSRAGTRASQGIDPLWMLNHFHFLDSGREGRRPLTFSRYAGPGSHRYPVGFSGDTTSRGRRCDFQPEFTATASNIGYGWWSHDIGGHIFGERDDELTRALGAVGVFSPILRLHSSSNPFLVKEPWLYPREARDAMTEALRFRHRLVPVPAHDEPPRRRRGRAARAADVPPRARRAARLRRCPTSSRSAPSCSSRRSRRRATRSRCAARCRAWLPPGAWVDVFTATAYDGDREVELHRDLGSIPVLLRAGGILPLAAEDDLDATRNPERLELLVAPGRRRRVHARRGRRHRHDAGGRSRPPGRR